MMRLVSIMLVLTLMYSCGSNKKVDKKKSEKEAMVFDYTAGPPTYLYKTKGDYKNLVPITLSDDKSKITSFPHPQDLYYEGNLAIPVELEDGYLLDNRGITKNVAFIDITYEVYSKLTEAPAPDSLFNLIVDNNPLIVLYNCGNRHQFKDVKKQLNEVILVGQLVNCKLVVGEE